MFEMVDRAHNCRNEKVDCLHVPLIKFMWWKGCVNSIPTKNYDFCEYVKFGAFCGEFIFCQ